MHKEVFVMNSSNMVVPVAPMNVKVQSSSTKALAKRFGQFSRKTAEGILEMGRAVHEARQLPEPEFRRFCELVQMKTSNLKKLAVIGSRYEYLMSRADKLPTSWSTVYAVAQLANDEIERLIDQGVVSSRLEIGDLEIALGKKPKPQAERIATLKTLDALTEWSFQVQIDPHPDPATRQVLKNLFDQLRAMKMQVQVAAQLERFLQAA
jgi:hypothetical protein